MSVMSIHGQARHQNARGDHRQEAQRGQGMVAGTAWFQVGPSSKLHRGHRARGTKRGDREHRQARPNTWRQAPRSSAIGAYPAGSAYRPIRSGSSPLSRNNGNGDPDEFGAFAARFRFVCSALVWLRISRRRASSATSLRKSARYPKSLLSGFEPTPPGRRQTPP